MPIIIHVITMLTVESDILGVSPSSCLVLISEALVKLPLNDLIVS